MSDTSDTTKDIERLRTVVEQKLGRKVCSPKDFQILHDAVYQECHEMVSISTLKRIWGYVQTTSLPRTSSLTPLAQYAGYADWEDFAEDRPVKTAETIETVKEKEPEVPGSQASRNPAYRLGIAVAIVTVATLMIWAVFAKGGKDSVPDEAEPATAIEQSDAPSGKRVLRKGTDCFRTTGDYLFLFGIEDGDSAYFRMLPGHKNIIVWGPEYNHPVWHNEGDKQKLMPTITEYWTPLPGENEDYTPAYIKEFNAGLYRERMLTDELRIVFMKNIADGFYVFLGIYRFDSEQSNTERTIWKRVADNCDLGKLDQLERLREDDGDNKNP